MTQTPPPPSLQISHSAAYSDWVGVIILTVASLMRGVYYLPAFAPLEDLSHPWWLNVRWWAYIWLVTGGIGLAACVARLARVTHQLTVPIASGLLVAVHFFWAMVLMVGVISGYNPRGYVNATTFLLICALATWAFGKGRSR
ncbi:hypothetical protein [Corynebacterium tapiri]|uniref:Uncharacterized protein n=1 Tax=Corynebacterium tapiri TaxID=1448266 RepID=A0A5C4U5Y5_9CORY|nr:hypothetical protein [Corynebacterium tapiri]TNL98763.1 hypothetical protein FHE74_03860 [Corynebacterium tapiri]